ncbi:aspartate aminotransferase family protein [Fulvitalea axinellae]|uniref:aspartate aminotransferase family protein n=1 Tax=Fulvitalea axinellae TaxID=1182444 RepID=UPI0030CA4553
MSNRQLFLEHQAQTSDFPMLVEISHAKGVYMYGPEGQKYIDLISGIGVSALGHQHPAVTQAVKDQAEKHMHVMCYGEFVTDPAAQLSKALADTLPDPLSVTYFLNSGSEATEASLKLAKRFTGRSELISALNSYHGSTQGALSVTGDEKMKRNFRPLLPDVRHIRYGNIEDLQYITKRTAGIILETVQGEAGVQQSSQEYWTAVRKRCDETGTLLILDEIQAGFGRTGKFWAFEHYGIQPDILLCAKAMGGGMPISGVISSHEIMSTLRNNPILGHISTFGGHPVSCAASLATLKAIQDEKLVESVDAKAELFKSLLTHPDIEEIRQIGLMMAVKFDSFKRNKAIIDKAVELGVISDWFLFCDDSFRMAPPLNITEEEIREACDIITQAIEATK